MTSISGNSGEFRTGGFGDLTNNQGSFEEQRGFDIPMVQYPLSAVRATTDSQADHKMANDSQIDNFTLTSVDNNERGDADETASVSSKQLLTKDSYESESSLTVDSADPDAEVVMEETASLPSVAAAPTIAALPAPIDPKAFKENILRLKTELDNHVIVRNNALKLALASLVTSVGVLLLSKTVPIFLIASIFFLLTSLGSVTAGAYLENQGINIDEQIQKQLAEMDKKLRLLIDYELAHVQHLGQDYTSQLEKALMSGEALPASDKLTPNDITRQTALSNILGAIRSSINLLKNPDGLSKELADKKDLRATRINDFNRRINAIQISINPVAKKIDELKKLLSEFDEFTKENDVFITHTHLTDPDSFNRAIVRLVPHYFQPTELDHLENLRDRVDIYLQRLDEFQKKLVGGSEIHVGNSGNPIDKAFAALRDAAGAPIFGLQM